MADNIQYAGQFSIGDVKLFTASGNTLDIGNTVSAINIYEDIFKSSISGDITITDTNNLIMEAPIVGQEYLGFKIITPGLDNVAIDYTDNVFAITRIINKVSSQPGVQVFSLEFCSPEGLRNYRVRTSKSYTDSIDAIVEDLLTSKFYINSKKTLFIEPTKGIRKIVAPNSPPFRLINQLKVDAISKKHNSPHYMFYENIRGIHFRTLDSLYAQKSIGNFNTGDSGSFDVAKKGPGNIEAAFKTAIRFQQNGNNDMLRNTVSGLLASNILTHDIYSKSFKYDDFEYHNDFYKNNRVNYENTGKDNPIYAENPIDEFDNTVSQFTDSKIHLQPTSTVSTIELDSLGLSTAAAKDAQYYDTKTKSYPYTPNNVSKTMLSRQSKVAELTNGMSIVLEVHGTTTITAGNMINFSMPVTGAEHSGDKFDKYYSGKYLITGVRHMFDITQKKHKCLLSCIKDSINSELPMNDLALEPKAERGGLITDFYI